MFPVLPKYSLLMFQSPQKETVLLWLTEICFCPHPPSQNNQFPCVSSHIVTDGVLYFVILLKIFSDIKPIHFHFIFLIIYFISTISDCLYGTSSDMKIRTKHGVGNWIIIQSTDRVEQLITKWQTECQNIWQIMFTQQWRWTFFRF